jgi:hypothetical protein
MTTNAFVPLRDLPDLQPGDLLLLDVQRDAQRPLHVREDGRVAWCHFPDRARFCGFSVSNNDQQMRELARLRGVTRADLADDRWPETERRLRAAAASAPKVGDAVPLTEEAWRALPPGTLVKVGPVCHVLTAEHPGGWCGLVWCDAREGMKHPCLGTPGDAGTILALDVALTDDAVRAALGVRALGARATATGPVPKRGDSVTGRWGELLPGAVVDVRDHSETPLAVKREDGLWSAWHALIEDFCPSVDAWTDEDGCDPVDGDWDAEYPDAMLAGQVTIGATGDQFVRELAEQGHEPARAALREVAPKPEPLKVGDAVPADRLNELPVGAVTLQCEGGQPQYVAVKRQAGWDFVCLDASLADALLGTGGLRPKGGARLVALGCTAEDRTGFTRQLAAAGHEPAREWVRKHCPDPPPAKPAAPRTLRDIEPGTLSQTSRGWTYRLPNGNGWHVSIPSQRESVVSGAFLPHIPVGWSWSGPDTHHTDENAPVLREIPNVKPSDLAPGAWERLIGEAPPEHAKDVTAVDPATFTGAVTFTPKHTIGDFEQATATLFKPLPKPCAIGDTFKCWSDVPPGTIVVDSAGDLALVRADGHGWLTVGTRKCKTWPAFTNGDHPIVLRVVALTSPDSNVDDAHTVVERQLTAQSAKALDTPPAVPHHEDMASIISTSSPTSTTFQLPGGATSTVTQREGEPDGAYYTRVDAMRGYVATLTAPDAQPQPPAVPAQPTSALARFGATLAKVGGEFANDGVKALVDGKRLVMLDAGRLGVHRVISELVEAVGGEAAAIKALRVLQHPALFLAEDALLATGLSVAGKEQHAAPIRQRVVRRIGDGLGEAIVSKGADFVSKGTTAIGALLAAVTADALPEGTTTETAQEDKT